MSDHEATKSCTVIYHGLYGTLGTIRKRGSLMGTERVIKCVF